MKRTVPISIVLVLLAFSLHSGVLAQDSGDQDTASAADSGFKLVVNAANPSPPPAARAISNMFLKRESRWDHGERVTPVDQLPETEVRKVFSKAVHKKSVSAIKSYWQRMIFSGRGVPPEELSSDAAVLEFVGANPGAIGYVSSETELNDAVRELKWTKEK